MKFFSITAILFLKLILDSDMYSESFSKLAN